MKQNILLLAILLFFMACETQKNISPKIVENSINSHKSIKNPNKTLTVDLDKKRTNQNRGDSNKEIIKGSILLGNNDEVSFKGNILREKAPITITYGDNDEVSLKGDDFTIKASTLKDGMHIIIRDKNHTIFVDQTIREY